MTFTPPSFLFDLSQWSKQADRTTLGVKGSSFKSFRNLLQPGGSESYIRGRGAISANYFVSRVSRILDLDVTDVTFSTNPPDMMGAFLRVPRCQWLAHTSNLLCLWRNRRMAITEWVWMKGIFQALWTKAPARENYNMSNTLVMFSLVLLSLMFLFLVPMISEFTQSTIVSSVLVMNIVTWRNS